MKGLLCWSWDLLELVQQSVFELFSAKVLFGDYARPKLTKLRYQLNAKRVGVERISWGSSLLDGSSASYHWGFLIIVGTLIDSLNEPVYSEVHYR